jgi:hypothetical protein
MLVILPIKAYEELLDQAEDAEDVAWLKKIGKLGSDPNNHKEVTGDM